MYLGRFQLGDSIPLSLGTRTGDGVLGPQLPSAAPVAKTYDASGTLVETIKLPIKNRYKVTAYFEKRHRLSSSYSAGRYLIVYQWVISATTYQAAAVFDIIEGGNADGAVIALQGVSRPEAIKVLYETESGKLNVGRNPT